jgi:asparagine synthase (glutamine-hydrolysing)
VITEARKRGFLVPLERWLRQRARGLIAEYGPSRDDACLQASYVSELVREHEQGIDHTARLWRIIAFQVWRREVLDAPRHAVVTHTAGRA